MQDGVEPDTETLVHEFCPFTLYCTVYDVIGVPPSFVGAFHVRDMLCNPGVVLKLVGASGMVAENPFIVDENGPEVGPPLLQYPFTAAT